MVNKPSNASYHRLNTDEKRNFRAGRTIGDPRTARLRRCGGWNRFLAPPQPHRQPGAAGDAVARRHGADADGRHGDRRASRLCRSGAGGVWRCADSSRRPADRRHRPADRRHRAVRPIRRRRQAGGLRRGLAPGPDPRAHPRRDLCGDHDQRPGHPRLARTAGGGGGGRRPGLARHGLGHAGDPGLYRLRAFPGGHQPAGGADGADARGQHRERGAGLYSRRRRVRAAGGRRGGGRDRDRAGPLGARYRRRAAGAADGGPPTATASRSATPKDGTVSSPCCASAFRWRPRSGSKPRASP